MFLGLPGAVMISSLFWQKAWGVSTSPLAVSCAMVLVLAVAITSAGAPLMMFVTSVCEPANEYVALNPGWSVSSAVSTVLNVEVSEDAASTVIDPLKGSGVAEGPPVPCVLDEPHAASASAAVTETRIGRGPIFMISSVVDPMARVATR